MTTNYFINLSFGSLVTIIFIHVVQDLRYISIQDDKKNLKLCSRLKLSYNVGFVPLPTGTSFRFMEKERCMKRVAVGNIFLCHISKSLGKIMQ